MLISKDLPGAETPEIGPVENNIAAQYVCELNDSAAMPLIMMDGSFVAFYEFETDMDMLKTINEVGEGQYQFYRIKNKWYGAIKVDVEYQLKIKKKDLLFGVLKGTRKTIEQLEQHTEYALGTLAKVKGKSLRYCNSPIFKLIEMDCNSDVPKPTGNLKSNISIMQTGEDKFSQIMNISNIDMIPMKKGIIDDSVVLYISVIRMKSDEEKTLKDKALERMSVMQMLAPQDTGVTHVHTIASTDDAMIMIKNQFYFIECSMVIQTETSLEQLVNKEREIRQILSQEDLSVYTPTNGQRQQFISMLPGLASYSETMQLATKPFVDKALLRMVAL